MVDPTKGVGPVQSVSSANKSSSAKNSGRGEDVRKADRNADVVKISNEALSLAQAERTAAGARAQIERNPGVTLGLDPSFDTAV